MEIHASAENYLETILILQKRNGQVRSIDVVNELGVTKPSVSVAMKNLRQSGMIEVDANGYITLLAEGQTIAEKIYERHTILTEWLIQIGVPTDIADKDACKIEHVISAESFLAIKKEYQAKHHRQGNDLPSHLL